jgi:GAF domain-containing protein
MSGALARARDVVLAVEISGSLSSVAAAICARARETFDAESALLVTPVASGGFHVDWRDPPSSILPAGLFVEPGAMPDLSRRIEHPAAVPVLIDETTARLSLGDRVLLLTWSNPYPADTWVESELVFLRFVDQAWLALERAERASAGQDAQSQERQTRRLLALTMALSAAQDVDSVVEAIREVAIEHMGAVDAHLYALEGEPMPTRVADAVRSRDVVLAEAQSGSFAAFPLSVGSTPVGGGEFGFAGRRVFDTDDRLFLAAVGRQAGLGLERARLQAVEHSIAVRLQRQLLPLSLPDVDGARAAAEYRAGTAAMEVGGDWYDVFHSGPGRLSFTVGDVVGKGITAAGVMGRLRSALRALTLTSDDLSWVIQQLDRFAGTIDGAEFTTLALADLELETGRLRYVHAGQPPFLIVFPDGTARYVEGGRRAPLAVPDPDGTFAETTLAPGSLVVLYSDGLVERRGELLDARLELLRDEAARLARLPLDELPRALVASLVGDAVGADDVVVLAVAYDGLEVR